MQEYDYYLLYVFVVPSLFYITWFYDKKKCVRSGGNGWVDSVVVASSIIVN